MTNGTLGQKDSKDHPAGLFWYHPHVHMTTSRQQIQLPGGPSVWSVLDVDTDKLEPLQSEVIPSPGRIEGTDSIYQFDFRKKGPESTTVTLVANPPVSWPCHKERMVYTNLDCESTIMEMLRETVAEEEFIRVDRPLSEGGRMTGAGCYASLSLPLLLTGLLCLNSGERTIGLLLGVPAVALGSWLAYWTLRSLTTKDQGVRFIAHASEGARKAVIGERGEEKQVQRLELAEIDCVRLKKCVHGSVGSGRTVSWLVDVRGRDGKDINFPSFVNREEAMALALQVSEKVDVSLKIEE